MPIRKRINLKLYLSVIIVTTAITALFCKNSIEILCVVVVAIGASLNQLLLIKGVEYYVNSALDEDKKSSKKLKRKALLFQLIKFLILVLSLSLSVQFMGKRVIIPLSNYIAILMIFAFSFKKDSQ